MGYEASHYGCGRFHAEYRFHALSADQISDDFVCFAILLHLLKEIAFMSHLVLCLNLPDRSFLISQLFPTVFGRLDHGNRDSSQFGGPIDIILSRTNYRFLVSVWHRALAASDESRPHLDPFVSHSNSIPKLDLATNSSAQTKGSPDPPSLCTSSPCYLFPDVPRLCCSHR